MTKHLAALRISNYAQGYRKKLLSVDIPLRVHRPLGVPTPVHCPKPLKTSEIQETFSIQLSKKKTRKERSLFTFFSPTKKLLIDFLTRHENLKKHGALSRSEKCFTKECVRESIRFSRFREKVLQLCLYIIT